MESFNAATTLQVSYKKPLLSSVDHWDDWIEALQSFAEGQGFWSEVNPDNPELPADALVQPRVATSVECQEFISKESTPTNPVTLHDAIQYHLMLYQEQVRRYKEQESKERTIHSWMASTVLPSVHASVLAKIRKDATTSHVTPRQVAKELKARFAQDPVVSSAATSSRYKDLLQQAHMANVEPERWIADWNAIYQKGISQDILEVKGPNAIRDFLRAVGARFEPAWAHGKLAKLVEYNGTIPSTFTLTGLAEEFMRYRRATRVFDARDNSVNATLGTQTSNNTNNPKPKGCPCNTFHKWQPHQCLAVYHAVTGQPVADIKPMSKGACTHIKQQYDSPKWEHLGSRIRKDGWKLPAQSAPTSSGSTYPGNLSAATLDPKLWIPTTFTNFKASSGTHALFNSTLYDNCGALHVVNSRDRLVPGSFVPSDGSDYLEAATTSFKISGRGTRVMKNILNGINVEKSEDLTLLDVAVVEGFHVNIASESRLKMKDAWYCGFDCTMRFGSNG
ncbi:hypothetical protein E4U44_002895 [Claviceps purpurea]|nr:hypothetical protein E4U44_002895 [Claviceps purpurea]